MVQLNLIKTNQFWLSSIAAALISIHLNLTSKSGNPDLLSSSFLFWIAGAFLIWKKRKLLNLDSGVFSSFLGILLIGLVLFKSIHLSSNDIFLRISPVISILGLGLLASGVSGLKQYWQQLVLMTLLAIPPGLVSLFIDPSLITAKFAALILWILGFQVVSSGVKVILPTGSIEVYYGCAGISMILQLLGLALIFLMITSTSLKQKVLLPILAIIVGFVINSMRVALMGVLVGLSDQKAFEYWHLGAGSLAFSSFAVIAFGVVCLNIQQTSDNEVNL